MTILLIEIVHLPFIKIKKKHFLNARVELLLLFVILHPWFWKKKTQYFYFLFIKHNFTFAYFFKYFNLWLVTTTNNRVTSPTLRHLAIIHVTNIYNWGPWGQSLKNRVILHQWRDVRYDLVVLSTSIDDKGCYFHV